MIVWIIPAALWAVGFAAEILGYNLPFLTKARSEEITENVGILTGVIFSLWAVLWRPFERHNALETELRKLKEKPPVSLEIEEASFITDKEVSFAVFVRVSNRSENKTADNVHLTLISVDDDLACNTGKIIRTPTPIASTEIKSPSINPGADATFRLGSLRVSNDGKHVFTLSAEPQSYYLNILAEKSYRISFQATARDFPPCETECELILKETPPLVGFFIMPKRT
jgi:hypothetical protein